MINADCTAFTACDDVAMTLLDYFALTRSVAVGITRLKDALASADSPDEVVLLAARLKKACVALSQAECDDAGLNDRKEAARVIEFGNRLAFAVKIVGTGQSEGDGDVFPRLYTKPAA
jgi:hypothetical protein